MGCLAIALMLIALIGGAIGFGPLCHTFKGIQPICIGPQGQFAGLVVMVIAAAGAIYILATSKKRGR